MNWKCTLQNITVASLMLLIKILAFYRYRRTPNILLLGMIDLVDRRFFSLCNHFLAWYLPWKLWLAQLSAFGFQSRQTTRRSLSWSLFFCFLSSLLTIQHTQRPGSIGCDRGRWHNGRSLLDAITMLEAFSICYSPLSALHTRRALVTLHVLYIAAFVSYACFSYIINVVLFLKWVSFAPLYYLTYLCSDLGPVRLGMSDIRGSTVIYFVKWLLCKKVAYNKYLMVTYSNKN